MTPSALPASLPALPASVLALIAVLALATLALAIPAALRARAAAAALRDKLDAAERRTEALTGEVRQREAEAAALIAGVAEGVFSVDRQRRIRYVNPQFAALLGVAPKDAVGRFCGDVLRPAPVGGARPCEEHCPIVHARFRGGARATERLTTAGGPRTVVLTSGRPEAGVQVQVVRDESEIEATRRLRDAVLANISHEFRTPLSAQLASLELLLDRLPTLGREEIAQLAVAQQRGTLRLAQLVDNLIESVRIEAGEAGLRRRPVALEEVLEEAVETTRPLFDQRHQDVVVDLPYPAPELGGDAPRLVQALVNLLANSNKFAPEGSTVRLGAAAAGPEGGVVLWVQDEGPGLPPDAADAPFTRFWRATGEEPEEGGAGLGLAIVKSIAERHGGRVRATGGPGAARMEIILPADPPARDRDSDPS